MTTTTPTPPDPGPDGNRAELVGSLLEWLESRDRTDAEVSLVLDTLSNRRRRVAIDALRDHGEALTLPDLAEEVAVAELERPLTEISPETVTEIYASLYHDHLPRIEDAGLVAYEQERDLVVPAFD